MEGRVKFPREFLVQSARRDYQDITRAFLREWVQNSRDAKAKNIELRVERVTTEDGKIRVAFTCNDDGIGMNQEIIETKLMVMGGTTKTDDGESVGGLGIAKLATIYSQDAYRIDTRDVVCTGVGSDYKVEASGTFVKGCHARVIINPDVISADAESLVGLYRREIQKSYLPGVRITLNGEVVEAARKAGRRCHDFGSGVTLHKTALSNGISSSYVAVRSRGLHMFDLYVNDCRHDMVVELSGYSLEIITSNRDGFRRQWQDRVSSLVQQLNLNSNAADVAKVHHYQGRYSRKPAQLAQVLAAVNKAVVRLAVRVREAAAGAAAGGAEAACDGTAVVFAVDAASLAELRAEIGSTCQAGGLSAAETQAVAEAAVLALVKTAEATEIDAGGVEVTEEDVGLDRRPDHHYFVETKGKFRNVPAKWKEENLSRRHRGMLETWASVVALVLAHSGKAPTAFDVGFVLDDGTDGDQTCAAYARLDGRHVFLLNPLLSGGDDSDLPLTKKGRLAMVMYFKALAEHEVTHFLGRKWHDESFTSAEMTLRRMTGANIKEYLKIAKR